MRFARYMLAASLSLAAMTAAAVTATTTAGATPRLPLRFEANRGQTDSTVRYVARGPGYTLFLTDDAAVWKLVDGEHPASVVKLRFRDAHAPVVTGERAQSALSHYYDLRGAKAPVNDVPSFAQVRYAGLWTGVDLVYHGGGGALEYDFELLPRADPSQIALDIDGADDVRIAADGGLELVIGTRTVRFDAPLTYLQDDPQHRPVPSRYRIAADGSVRFDVGAYDRDRALVIDPVFVYSTLLGGSLGDGANGVVLDASGQAIVTGYTASLDFPLANALDPSYAGGTDAFLAKFNATGSGLLFSTYLGGANAQIAYDVAIAGNGDIVLGGNNSVVDPDGDIFVVRVGSAGAPLVYSQTFGGTSTESFGGLALDSAGNAYIVGTTADATFPTVSPPQPACGGTSAFLRKIGPAGTVIYSTCIGDVSRESPSGVAVDAAGRLHIVGTRDGVDAFAWRLNLAATTFQYRKNFGGTGNDGASALAIDAASNAYITGSTSSTDFPIVNGLQGSNGGGTDAFFAMLDSAGNIAYSTYLGGSATQGGNAIAVGPGNGAFIAGTTYQFSGSFGNPDLFALRLDRSGNSFSVGYSSTLRLDLYAQGEVANGIAVDAAGDAYVAGVEYSGFITTPGAFQTTHVDYDQPEAFLFKLSPALPTLSIADATIAEGTGGSSSISLQVTLSTLTPDTVTVNYTTGDGSATAPGDYTAASGTLTFGPGQTTAWINVPVVRDSVVEADESFAVTLSGAVKAAIADATATATLTNDDAAGSIQFSAASYGVGESDGSATITVTRSGGSASGVGVNYATANGSAVLGVDYTTSEGVLTFGASETTKTFTVPILADNLVEGSETVSLTLYAPFGGAAVGSPSTGTLTIVDDDVGGSIQFSNATLGVAENAGTLQVQVTRTGGSAAGVSVNVASANGSATAGGDYGAVSTTLSFGAGETVKTFNVAILDDTIAEGNETFSLTLSSAAGGASLGAPSTSTVTITDDDAGGQLKFSAATYSIAENAGSATITVSRTGGAASGVTVNYATANISATAGSDYTSASGTLTFDAGDTSKTFSVPLLDDTIVEGPEMVSLSLGAATGGASLGSPSTATLTITENDAGGTLQLSAPTYSVAENVGTATFTVTRTGGAASGVSVHYATTGGTASVGSDYTTTSGDLAFGAGDSTKTFTVPITNDAIQETSETFDVQLTSATGGSALGTPSFATVTITDDDAANGTLGLAACSVVVREGQASIAIPVQRTAGSNGVVTIQYATQNIDAIAGTDYTAASGTLSWPSGNANAQTITVPLSTNAGIEPRERFRVALSTPTGGASLGAIPNVVVWILDTPDQVFVDKFGDAWPCQ